MAKALQPREYLDKIESLYAPRTAGISLAAEVPFPERHAEGVVRAIGRIYSRARSRADGDPMRDLRSRPAAVVLGLSTFAAVSYQANGWWIRISEAAGVTPWQTEDAEWWGHAFRNACLRLRLTDFANLTSRQHIGPIIMHAGVPTVSLRGLVDEVRRAQGRLLTNDAAEIVAEITQRRRPASLHQPAFDFLIEGGIFAADVVQRLLDALDLEAHGEDLGAAQLPDRLAKELRRLLDADLLSGVRGPRSPERRDSATERASIMLEPWGEGVVLLVPQDRDHSWRVALDSHQTILPPSEGLLSSSLRPRRVVVQRPVRIVSTHPISAPPAPTVLIDPADPLLVFSADGALLPRRRALPSTDVWVLHPDTMNVGIPTDRLREESTPSMGWRGWTLRRYDLAGLDAVTLGGGPIRPVAGKNSARLLTPVPDRSLSRNAEPVYSSRPLVQLPDVTGVTWTVTVQPVGRPEARIQTDWQHGRDVDPWHGRELPVVGTYEITVRGPLGRGIRQRVHVAEGIRARCSVEFRPATEVGLIPVDIDLECPPAVSVQPPRLVLGPLEPDGSVLLSGPDNDLPVLVTPPHRWFARHFGQVLGAHEYGPMTMTVESLTSSEPGTLEAGGIQAQDHRVLYEAGEYTQTIAPDGIPRRDRLRFDLRSLTDTVRSGGPGYLYLVNPHGRELAARVRPRTVHSGAHLQGTTLVLERFCGLDDIVVAVYPALAPWREPFSAPASRAGTVVLPDALIDAGPLLVVAGVSDPWLPWTPPEWPRVRDAFVLDQPGEPAPLDQAEAQLLRFLQGTSDDCGDDLHRVLLLLSRDEPLTTRTRRDLVAAAGSTLRRDLTATFRALVADPPRPEILPKLLVLSGLAASIAGPRAAGPPRPGPPGVRAPGSSADVDRRTRTALWQLNPATALITGDAGRWIHGDAAAVAEAGTDVEEFRDLAERVCGLQFGTMLDTGRDADASCGGFDASVDYLERLTAVQRRAAIAGMQLVPRAFLDGDRRVQAAVELFEHRNDRGLVLARTHAPALVREALAVLGAAGYPDSCAAVQARRHPSIRDDWRELSAVSTALAHVARVAARSVPIAQRLERGSRELWGALAALAPDLVTIDLAVAECLVAWAAHRRALKRAENPRQPTTPDAERTRATT